MMSALEHLCMNCLNGQHWPRIVNPPINVRCQCPPHTLLHVEPANDDVSPTSDVPCPAVSNAAVRLQ